MGRNFIGIDLYHENCRLSSERCRGAIDFLCKVGLSPPAFSGEARGHRGFPGKWVRGALSMDAKTIFEAELGLQGRSYFPLFLRSPDSPLGWRDLLTFSAASYLGQRAGPVTLVRLASKTLVGRHSIARTAGRLRGLGLLGDDLRPIEPQELGSFFSVKRRTAPPVPTPAAIAAPPWRSRRTGSPPITDGPRKRNRRNSFPIRHLPLAKKLAFTD